MQVESFIIAGWYDLPMVGAFLTSVVIRAKLRWSKLRMRDDPMRIAHPPRCMASKIFLHLYAPVPDVTELVV